MNNGKLMMIYHSRMELEREYVLGKYDLTQNRRAALRAQENSVKEQVGYVSPVLSLVNGD